MTPLPKGVLDPPRTVRFPPPFRCQRSVFPVQKIHGSCRRTKAPRAESPKIAESRPRDARLRKEVFSQRTPWGGWKKRGGWENLTNDTPPKRGFGSPSYGTLSTPLRCQCSVFPMQKSTAAAGVRKLPERLFYCVCVFFFFFRRLKFIQYRTGVWKCHRSLSPDPSPSTG